MVAIVKYTIGKKPTIGTTVVSCQPNSTDFQITDLARTKMLNFGYPFDSSEKETWEVLIVNNR